MIYLAGPYSDADPEIEAMRFRCLTIVAGSLIRQGRIVLSPITHSHPIHLELLAHLGESLTNDQWREYDEAFMNVCSEMVILRLPGWEQSKGIKQEIAYFEAQGKRISYIDLPMRPTLAL